MSTPVLTIEDCLIREVRRWLSQTLADAAALPTEAAVREWDRASAALAFTKARDDVGAVRLYVSTALEVANTHGLAGSTVRLCDLAAQLCDQVDEEVNRLEGEL